MPSTASNYGSTFPSESYSLSTLFGAIILNVRVCGEEGRSIFASCKSVVGVVGDRVTASIIAEISLPSVTMVLIIGVDGAALFDSFVGV